MVTYGHNTHLDRIADEAAAWVVRMQSPDTSAADRDAFADWLCASSEHIRAYLELDALTHDVAGLNTYPIADDLVELAKEESDAGTIIPLFDLTGYKASMSARAEPDSRTGKRFWVLAGSAIAASVLITVAAIHQFGSPPRDTYVTAIGEQISFPLPDQSVVTLNAQSEVRLAFSDTYRDVYLLAGEALFEVEKDANRPFRVFTSDTFIQAIGTAFNVYHRDDRTTITVVEGIVDVVPHQLVADPTGGGVELSPVGRDTVAASITRLRAGQQAQIDVKSSNIAVVKVNAENAAAWRQRRLVFESKALADVVAEFNRYNIEQRLVIADPVIANTKIGGVFGASDPESFALFLQEAGLVKAETRMDGTIALKAMNSQ